MKASDLLVKLKATNNAPGGVLQKLSDVVCGMEPMMQKGTVEGSYEKLCLDVAPYVQAGCGCADPPKMVDGALEDRYGDGYDEGPKYHYLAVIATTPTSAIVHCYDENKAWDVPYSMDGDNVTTGEPTEVEQIYRAVEGEDGNDNATQTAA